MEIVHFPHTGDDRDPALDLGDGDTSPDWEVLANGDGTFAVWLRAERSGTGTGRVYALRAAATDASGNSATASASVTVPRDQRGIR